MAPTTTAVFRAVADFAALNREVRKTHRDIEQLQRQAGQTGQFEKFNAALDKTAVSQAKLRKETDALAKSQGNLGKGTSGLSQLEKSLASLAATQDRAAKAGAGLTDAHNKQLGVAGQLRGELTSLGQSVRSLTSAEDAAIKRAQDHAKALADERNSASQKTNVLNKLADTLHKTAARDRDAASSAKQHADALKLESDAADRARGSIDPLGASVKDAGSAARQAATSHDAFTKALDRVAASARASDTAVSNHASSVNAAGRASFNTAHNQESLASSLTSVGTAARSAATNADSYNRSASQVGANSRSAGAEARRLGSSLSDVGSGARSGAGGVGVLGAVLNPLRSGMRSAGEAGKGLRIILLGLAVPAAVSGIELLGGSLVSLVAALTAIVAAATPAAGALAALGPAAVAAAGAVGTVMLAFRGVGDALKAMTTLEQQGASGSQAASRQRVTAARAVESAQRSLRDAVQAQQDAEIQGARRVRDAQEALVLSQQRVLRAEQALHDARRQAIRDLEDLSDRVHDNALSEEGAEIRLLRAQERLREVNADATASALDRREAALGVAEAEDNLNDVRRQATRDQQDLNAAQKSGVDGMPGVVSAQDSLADAQRSQRDAARNLAETQQDVARAQRDAAERVADATDRLADAQQQAAQSADTMSAAQRKLAAALDKLSPKGRELVQLLWSMRGRLDELSKASQEAMFPGLINAIKILSPLIDSVFLPSVKAIGTVIGAVAERASGEIKSWESDLVAFGTGDAPKLIDSFGTILINLASAMEDVGVAAVPLLHWLTSLGVRLSEYWKAEAEAGRKDGSLAAYFEKVRRVLELLGDIIYNLGGQLKSIFQAAAPYGEEMLRKFEELTRRTREWMNSTEGKDRLNEFFRKTSANAEKVLGILKDIALAILKMGESEALGKMLDAINVDLKPSLSRFFEKLGKAMEEHGPDIIHLLSTLLDIVTELMGGPGGGFSAFIAVLQGFADVLLFLVKIPGFSEIAGILLAIAGGLAAIKAVGKIGNFLTLGALGGLNRLGGGAAARADRAATGGRGTRGAPATSTSGFVSGLTGRSSGPAQTGTARAGQFVGQQVRRGAAFVASPLAGPASRVASSVRGGVEKFRQGGMPGFPAPSTRPIAPRPGAVVPSPAPRRPGVGSPGTPVPHAPTSTPTPRPTPGGGGFPMPRATPPAPAPFTRPSTPSGPYGPTSAPSTRPATPPPTRSVPPPSTTTPPRTPPAPRPPGPYGPTSSLIGGAPQMAARPTVTNLATPPRSAPSVGTVRPSGTISTTGAAPAPAPPRVPFGFQAPSRPVQAPATIPPRPAQAPPTKPPAPVQAPPTKPPAAASTPAPRSGAASTPAPRPAPAPAPAPRAAPTPAPAPRPPTTPTSSATAPRVGSTAPPPPAPPPPAPRPAPTPASAPTPAPSRSPSMFSPGVSRPVQAPPTIPPRPAVAPPTTPPRSVQAPPTKPPAPVQAPPTKPPAPAAGAAAAPRGATPTSAVTPAARPTGVGVAPEGRRMMGAGPGATPATAATPGAIRTQTPAAPAQPSLLSRAANTAGRVAGGATSLAAGIGGSMAGGMLGQELGQKIGGDTGAAVGGIAGSVIGGMAPDVLAAGFQKLMPLVDKVKGGLSTMASTLSGAVASAAKGAVGALGSAVSKAGEVAGAVGRAAGSYLKLGVEAVAAGAKTAAAFAGNVLKSIGGMALAAGQAALEFIKMGVQAGISAARTLAVNAASLVVRAGIMAWTAAQWLLNAALNANPIGLVVLAIAALVAALIWAWNNSETFRNIVMGMWEGIKTAFSAAMAFITPIWNAFWNALKAVATAIWDTFGAYFVAAWEVLKALFQAGSSIISTVWSAGWEAIKTVAMAVWNAISGFFMAVWEVFKAAWQLLVDILSGNWSKVWDDIKNLGMAIWNAIAAFFTGAWDIFKALFQAVLTFLSTLWSASWDAIKTAAVTIWNAIKAFFDTAWNAWKAAFQAVVDFIKALWDGFWNVLKTVAETAWNWLKSGIEGALNFIKGLFQSIVDGIKSIWEGIKEIIAVPIRFVVNTVWNNGIVALWNKAADLLPGIDPIEPYVLPFATGGAVPGAGNTDSVKALLTPGEFVVRKQVAEPARDFLEALNAGQPEAVQATGAKSPVRRYNKGGLVDSDGYSHYAVGGAVDKGLNWARSQQGKPYVWGGVGPGGYDCSGFMSAITNVLNNKSPYRRIGTTASAPWGGWTTDLSSAFGVGYFKGDPGHMAGTLGGVNVESRGGAGVNVGPAARGATNPMFSGHMSLPMVGGEFVDGGAGGDAWYNPLPEIIDGFFSTLVDPLINQIDTFVKPPPKWNATPKSIAQSVRDSIYNFLMDLATSSGGTEAGSGPAQEQVRAVAAKYGWNEGPEWDAIVALVNKESGWDPNAANPSSSARGLFQKMTSIHGPVEPTPAGQAEWGLRYIKDRYGTPSAAWRFHQAHNYYARGGLVYGFGSNDSQPAMLTPGEFIVRKEAVDALGLNTLRSLNNSGGAIGASASNAVQRFAMGGAVQKNGGLAYQVTRGDSLSSIARKFNTTVAELAKLNMLSNVNKIFSGQWLKLPGKPTDQTSAKPMSPDAQVDRYQIKKGDTLWSLAQRFKTTVAELARLNNIKDPGKIYAGSWLSIPKPGTKPGEVKPGSPETQTTSSATETPKTAQNVLQAYGESLASTTNDTREFESNLLTLTRWGYSELATALAKMGIGNTTSAEGGGGLALSREAIKSPAAAAKVNAIVKDSQDVLGESLETVLAVVGSLQKKAGQGLREVSTDTKIDTKAIFEAMTARALAEVAKLPAANRDKFLSNIDSYKRGLPFNQGGRVWGTGNQDTVPAMLTPGEFVLRKAAASKIGMPTLHRLNNADRVPVQAFAQGGKVLDAAELFSLVSPPKFSRPRIDRAVQERLAAAVEKSGNTTNSKSVVFNEGAVKVLNPAPARAVDSFESVMQKLTWAGAFS